MKTKIAAIVAALAVAIAVTAAVLIGTTYTTAVVVPLEITETSQPFVPPSEPAVVEAATEEPTEQPTQADIPADYSEQDRADALGWLAWQQRIDDCMGDAGWEYTYWAYWQPSTPGDALVARSHFPESYTRDELVAATLALGGNAGGGADYRWEDAGCQGEATHHFGFTS